MALSVQSERLGKTVLAEAFSNIDGDQAVNLAFPSGFGDCVVHHIHVRVTSIATLLANPQTKGPEFLILSSGSNVVATFGTEYWKLIGVDDLACTVRTPAPGILVGATAGEVIRMSFEEVDTNAVPTADATVYVEVTRLRP